MSIRLSNKHGVNPTLGVCFWCGVEDNTIGLLGKLPGRGSDRDPEAPRHMVLSMEPCGTCKNKMSRGVTLAEAGTGPDGSPEPTGHWWVISEDAARRWFTPDVIDSVMEHRRAFVDRETAEALGLYAQQTEVSDNEH